MSYLRKATYSNFYFTYMWKVLCWLGFHRPDEENKVFVYGDRWGNPVYSSKCLRCNCDMQQIVL